MTKPSKKPEPLSPAVVAPAAPPTPPRLGPLRDRIVRLLEDVGRMIPAMEMGHIGAHARALLEELKAEGAQE